VGARKDLISALWLVVGACSRPAPPPPPVLGQVGDFRLTDQAGRATTAQDLAGQAWVADIMFTRCPSVCPLLTERLAGLDAGGARKVSFTIDPEFDTPPVLAAYAAAHHAEWTFLTGATDAVARDLKVGVDRENGALVHDTHFVLVDAERKIRGYYDSSDPDALARLAADARALAATRK
jgi:protein SCO1/2